MSAPRFEPERRRVLGCWRISERALLGHWHGGCGGCLLPLGDDP
jgi:hypothetical protein